MTGTPRGRYRIVGRMEAAQQQHGLSDDELPAELRERQQLLNEAVEAILNGRPNVAKQKLIEQDLCADRARARVRERERFHD